MIFILIIIEVSDQKMSKLALEKSFKILQYPSQSLNQICQPVAFPLSEQTLSNISYLKSCFRKTLRSNTIVLGLSACQVGIYQRFFIFPTNLNYIKFQNSPSTMSVMTRNLKVIINPIILNRLGNQTKGIENCLSFGSSQYQVERQQKIKVRFQSITGDVEQHEMEGIGARIFQHQYDHLNGITIYDIGAKVANIQHAQLYKQEDKKVLLKM